MINSKNGIQGVKLLIKEFELIYNDNIIKQYSGEQKPVIAMRRYLDEQFNEMKQKEIIDLFDARALKFVNLATFKMFQKQMRLLKPQR